jgi:uncharacterized protein (TIGR00730 family)
MKRVTVFCGSSSGVNEGYMRQATLVGQTLAAQNIEVVYGGANIGLMGAVANGALSRGGKVIGVLPHFLKSKEIAHNQLTELILVDTMHERKLKMNELCDGIIALPGGFGTLEELFEMLTWSQLGLHKKPIGLLNIDRFYESLSAMIQTMVTQGFLKEVNQKMLLISDDIVDLVNQMNRYESPAVGKWISRETT